MAETNRTLNQSMASDMHNLIGAGGTYGFETARSNSNNAELQLKTEVMSQTASKSGSAGIFGDVEMAGISPYVEKDVDVSATSAFSAFNSPRHLLTAVSLPDMNGALTASRHSLIKHKRTREIERKYRKQAADQKTDFADFLQFLVQFYRSTQRLDAAGCTL